MPSSEEEQDAPFVNDACEKLYKYRSLDSDLGRRAAEDILVHSRLFWQCPSEFNDPFDCVPNIAFGQTPADRAAFRRRALRTNAALALPRAQRRAKATRNLKQPIKHAKEMFAESFDARMRNSAVTCFSKVPDSPLMWAHYAASHGGVCFEFQEAMGPPHFLAFDVEYADDRPIVDVTSMREAETLKAALLTKSTDWSYEHEKRMFDYDRGRGYRSFPTSCLIAVILGARISDTNRAFIISLNERRQTPLPIAEATLSRETFKIQINRR